MKNNTSYFIWLAIDIKKIYDIFIEINDLVWSKNVIELQNPLSMHITLYYLPWYLWRKEITEIRNFIDKIKFDKQKLTFWDLKYFWDSIAYISYDNYKVLRDINILLKKEFPEYQNIEDNLYPSYIAHSTLFKIIDYEQFLIYKKDIEEIINKNITWDFYNLDELRIGLYMVNSRYKPELQYLLK